MTSFIVCESRDEWVNHDPHNHHTMSLLPHPPLQVPVAVVKKELLGVKHQPDTNEAMKCHSRHLFDRLWHFLRHIILERAYILVTLPIGEGKAVEVVHIAWLHITQHP